MSSRVLFVMQLIYSVTPITSNHDLYLSLSTVIMVVIGQWPSASSVSLVLQHLTCWLSVLYCFCVTMFSAGDRYSFVCDSRCCWCVFVLLVLGVCSGLLPPVTTLSSWPWSCLTPSASYCPHGYLSQSPFQHLTLAYTCEYTNPIDKVND